MGYVFAALVGCIVGLAIGGAGAYIYIHEVKVKPQASQPIATITSSSGGSTTVGA